MFIGTTSNGKYLLAAVFSLFFHFYSSGDSRISGKVTNAQGEPLPFVNVVVRGSATGTTTNVDGTFTLTVPDGRSVVVFSMIGFHQLQREITPSGTDLRLDITLEPESYQLREVQVRADAEDPAYEIIRNAQRKRSYYLKQVKAYTCEAYVKSTQRLESYPKKFMGQKVDVENEIDTSTGIFYLSESVSTIENLWPDRFRETMISSKVSGEPRAYSFNRGADMLRWSLYQSRLTLDELVPRGVISPIGENALFYYRYRLEGTFVEDGETVNRIAVIPRRKNDPVFEGTVFISDDTWRLHSADLFITRDHQLRFLDTIRFRNTWMKVEEGCWMPFSNHFRFTFDLFGFKGAGDILGIFDNYDVHAPLKPDDFTGEVLKVEATSNKKDSAYWDQFRPVPLTTEEQRDYIRSDSVRTVQESPAYLDSTDSVANRIRPMFLLSGYDHRNSIRKTYWKIESPVKAIQFNTVQGWNSRLTFEYGKQRETRDGNRWVLVSDLQYGFSDRRFHPSITYSRRYNDLRLSRFSCIVGSRVLQFNSREPISPFINSSYSLLGGKNYMKVYAQQSFTFTHRSEPVNGLVLRSSLTMADRLPLSNTTDYTFRGDGDRYTVNDPILDGSDTVRFRRHTALLLDLNIRYVPGQRYVTYPDAKYIMGSKWPTFEVHYRKGKDVNGAATDFDFMEFHMRDEMDFELLGRFSYLAGAGTFLNRRQVAFMDWRHFNGNRTWFSGFRIDDFMGLDYYAFSTTGSFVEGHAEQHFKGFLMNKLPLIRKLRLDEVVSAHYVAVSGKEGLLEFGAGIEKLEVFRVQVYASYSNGKFGAPGIVFGVRNMF
ncbi:MAG: hypothetical protein RL021_1253 [Bacteroidota bacterium]|jgi:hypothetical protein